MIKKEIGKRLLKVRRVLGYTQEKLSSHFNIGRANYGRIEIGEISPNTNILHTLKMKFNVSLDWLITGKGEMFIKDKKIPEPELYPTVKIKGDLTEPENLKSIIEDFIKKAFPTVSNIDIDDFVNLIYDLEVDIYRYMMYVEGENLKTENENLEKLIEKFYTKKKKYNKKINSNLKLS